MPRCVSIPTDVWRRYAALDSVCDARLQRLDTAPRGNYVNWRNYSRMRVIEIWRRDDGEGSKVIAEGASLARTLEAAVRSAEREFGGS